jgi:hypothetical protein
MIKYLWCVVDPGLDRPFFSYDPPPDTLARTPGMVVIRYDYEVPDPVNNFVLVSSRSEEDAKAHAQMSFAKARDWNG